jgi:hypothetical protein
LNAEKVSLFLKPKRAAEDSFERSSLFWNCRIGCVSATTIWESNLWWRGFTFAGLAGFLKEEFSESKISLVSVFLIGVVSFF